MKKNDRKTCPKCGYVAEIGKLTACACGWRKGQHTEKKNERTVKTITDNQNAI